MSNTKITFEDAVKKAKEGRLFKKGVAAEIGVSENLLGRGDKDAALNAAFAAAPEMGWMLMTTTSRQRLLASVTDAPAGWVDFQEEKISGRKG